MKQIKFDFNNMFSFSVGKDHGISESELSEMSPVLHKAYSHIQGIIKDRRNRINLGLEWANLPYQDAHLVRNIQELGDSIAKDCNSVLFLGIGGSYLGLKAAQEALCAPYYNEFFSLRCGRPKIYFEGNNLDPETLSAALKNLDPAKTFVIVISKSGETTETKAAFAIVEAWLKNSLGRRYGRRVIAVTDPESGFLRSKVNQEQAKDALSFRNLPLLKGVGGRYSELNMGLLHLAIAGVDIQEVLSGAKAMAKRCADPNFYKNPALIYAALQTILYREKGKPVTILMPFSEMLKSTADWYSQLLAESTGKKYARNVRVSSDGLESWERNKDRVINAGRTPVSSRGTSDLHSIQQNNIEGENDKTITFVRIEKFRNDIKVPAAGGILSGKSYSGLLALAQEATEWALVRESRPNCTIILPELKPYHWGELIFFFEMATAFEGELLNLNAFDQPGVEGYKNYMYYRLGKPGLSEDVARQIKKYPLIKKAKLVI